MRRDGAPNPAEGVVLRGARGEIITAQQRRAARAAHLFGLVDKVANHRRHAGAGAGAQRAPLTTRPICVFGVAHALPIRVDARDRLWIASAPAEEVALALEAVADLPGRHRLATLARLYERLWLATPLHVRPPACEDSHAVHVVRVDVLC